MATVTVAQREFAERIKTEVARGILDVLRRQWQEELLTCLLCGRPTVNRYAWDETPVALPLWVVGQFGHND